MDYYFIIAVVAFFLSDLILKYMLWPSRKNTAFFISAPFIILVYIFSAPIILDFAKKNYSIRDYNLEFYSELLLLSTIINVSFFVIGFFSYNNIYMKIKRIIVNLEPIDNEKIKNYGVILSIITIALFAISYIGMGFIPLFSDSPMAAKYMSGEYQDAYKSFAVPYRVALGLSNIAIILLTIKLLTTSKLKNKIYALLLIAGLLACLIFSMRRSLIVYGITGILFSHFAFKSKIKYSILCILYFLFTFIGMAGNSLFFFFLGITDFPKIEDVFAGAPDIADQLYFIKCWFDGDFPYTFGTNLIGGLIPFHSEYNLSVLTLNVIGSQAGEAASGGFRLPVPLIGFISFGWLGCIAITGIYSYFSGLCLHIKKDILKDESYQNFLSINTLLIPYTLEIIPALFIGVGIDSVVMFFIIIAIYFFSRYKITI